MLSLLFGINRTTGSILVYFANCLINKREMLYAYLQVNKNRKEFKFNCILKESKAKLHNFSL